ncbi:hypothetical protein Tco_0605161, partial [Tanacetum coccineum]
DANTSEDPFKIYPLLKRIDKKDTIEIVSDGSMKYPPGFSLMGNKVECCMPNVAEIIEAQGAEEVFR